MANEKVCRSCGRMLPLDSFQRCSAVKDGRKARCKECLGAAQRARLAIPSVLEARRQGSRRWNQSPDGQAYHRAYKQTEQYKAREMARRLELRNIPKIKAREAVNSALRYGGMTNKPCAVCGAGETEAHHIFGYKPANWKNVVWLCPEHHQRAEEQLRKEREGNGTLP